MRNVTQLMLLTVGALSWAPVPGEATVIYFDVAHVGGDTYEFSYTVANDGLGVDIEELAIYFGFDRFENLRLPGAPPGWDPIVIQPDVLLSDDGFYDVLALSGGIPPAAELSGFSVWADFISSGVPGSQPFEILDPSTFGVLDSGFTIRAVAIAEPANLAVLGIGLVGLRRFARWRSRKRGRKPTFETRGKP